MGVFMHTQIGAFDAKAKLSSLLREVEQGNRFTITVRGRAVADLIPSKDAMKQNAHMAITAMNNIEKIKGVSEDTISDWIIEGRK